jgi:hypothetical protein
MDLSSTTFAHLLAEDANKPVNQSMVRSNSERLSRIGSENENVQDIRQINRMIQRKATLKKKTF